MTILEWLASASGAVLIATALHDVFHTLLQPSGTGRLTQAIFLGGWRLGRLAGERGKNVAAPLAIVSTAFAWAGMVAVGCALVYWPHLPERFYIAEGLGSIVHGNLVDALYVSGVALTTVGFGNVPPRDGLLRLVLVTEGLIGFALLSASISWILAIYPALQRSRALAGRISTLMHGDDEPRLTVG